MTEEFLIPGMYLHRNDIRDYFYSIYANHDEADEDANKLTDGQMEDIATAFASEFFDVREDLFSKILADAIESVQLNYDRHKSLYEDA